MLFIYNINHAVPGHAQCVNFVKKFGLPILLLGGGGYTIRNVARCWTYETATALDSDIANGKSLILAVSDRHPYKCISVHNLLRYKFKKWLHLLKDINLKNKMFLNIIVFIILKSFKNRHELLY